jgi:predicted flavoprotein YhiN
LRALEQPTLTIDLKPTFTAEKLVAKLGAPEYEQIWEAAIHNWRLSPAAAALLRSKIEEVEPLRLAQTAKNLSLTLKGPRPLAEAISTAGGIAWSELTDDLMLKKIPGVFAAGEMIDWDAPTGGYLLQGCFSTGTVAAQGAIQWLNRSDQASFS